MLGEVWSWSVCLGWLAVDSGAKELREALLDAQFQFGSEVVDAGDGECAIEYAVAGDDNLAFHRAYLQIVEALHLGEFAAKVGEVKLESAGKLL